MELVRKNGHVQNNLYFHNFACTRALCKVREHRRYEDKINSLLLVDSVGDVIRTTNGYISHSSHVC